MKSPWKTIQLLEPGRQYFVFASAIPPRNYAATPQMFRGASAVRKQLDGAPGLMGFSLLARPLRKDYATLSVWDEESSLRTFATQEPHRQLMADLAPAMGDTKFVQWTIDGADGHPSWREALQRLG